MSATATALKVATVTEVFGDGEALIWFRSFGTPDGYWLVLHDRRREEEQRAWQARYARERAERLEREAERRQGNLAWARSTQHRPAKFEGVCIVCSLQQPADKLRIANHQGRWLAFCAVHVSARGQ